MDEDADTQLAYFMLVKYGWRPQQIDDLPQREKALLLVMIQKYIHDLPQPEKG